MGELGWCNLIGLLTNSDRLQALNASAKLLPLTNISWSGFKKEDLNLSMTNWFVSYLFFPEILVNDLLADAILPPTLIP